jgi:hypothetical protein
VLAQLLVAGQGNHLHHVKVGRFAVDVVEAVGEAGREVGVLGGAAGALQAKRLLQGHPHRLLEVWKNFFFCKYTTSVPKVHVKLITTATDVLLTALEVYVVLWHAPGGVQLINAALWHAVEIPTKHQRQPLTKLKHPS